MIDQKFETKNFDALNNLGHIPFVTQVRQFRAKKLIAQPKIMHLTANERMALYQSGVIRPQN
jgi:hypothetical protein